MRECSSYSTSYGTALLWNWPTGAFKYSLFCPMFVLNITNTGHFFIPQVTIQPVGEPTSHLIRPISPGIVLIELPVLILVRFTQIQTDTLVIQLECFAVEQTAGRIARPAWCLAQAYALSKLCKLLT